MLLCGLPLFHVNGVMVTGLAPFHRGAQVLLAGPQGYRNPTPIQDFWKLVERYRVTSFSGVPTIYAALLQVPSDGRDLSSLRFALCGAAPMPVELIRQFEARTGLKVIEGYGLTEGTCGTSCNPRGERRPGSIGLRLPYCQVKVAVLDGEGNYLRDAAPNEVGNLCLKGPTVFKGYLQQDRNRDIWVGDGWFNTGDLGRIDEDGYIWLTGRSKDLIIRGGHNIDPQMIEEALHRHPAVALAAAVGKPDAKAGELPVVYIQLKPGASASEEELLEHASRHVPERAAVPKDVWLIESMPVTAVGKTFAGAAPGRDPPGAGGGKPEDRRGYPRGGGRRRAPRPARPPARSRARRKTPGGAGRAARRLRAELPAARRREKLRASEALAQPGADVVDFLQGHLVAHRVVVPAHLHTLRLQGVMGRAAERRVDHVVLAAMQVQDRNPLVALVQRQVVEGRRVGG